jgi:threonine dehydratase
MASSYIKSILQSRVYEAAIETPISQAPFLSKRLGNRVLLKREDLQPIFSFKIRGAYNKMVNLSRNERSRGVIAASAGNHAQGVALASQKLDIPATIVMPTSTPPIKVDSVRERGSRVILHGDNFNEAYQKSQVIAAREELTFIHPYDDELVIAGQGTIGLEILRQHSGPIDAVFVPVGGGGLIAGVSIYIKYLRPEIKVIGVEEEDSACLYAALQEGKRVSLDQVGIFADGTAVKQVGRRPFEIAQECVDQVITVNTDEICAAIKDIYTDTRSITEPAGALAIAGLKKYVQQNAVKEQTLMAVNSGANVNFDRLRYISERAEIGEKREGVLAVTIPERPGSFQAFCNVIGKRDITEFNYRFTESQDAHIFVGLKLKEGEDDLNQVIKTLKSKEYPVEDLTENEVAKTHIRYMVGGPGKEVRDKELYRFQFPERPGALLDFLNGINSQWSISLFHYRNHGAAYGRVLMGMEVPPEEKLRMEGIFQNLGYAYFEETGNQAYKLFLR